ncbi:transposase family protein [Actinokineospora sp. G85]|uniref:transposase family protein n=1 Tax=Actinokineospora sp. G85 TaxID=3406626 RepID=UPI003C730482
MPLNRAVGVAGVPASGPGHPGCPDGPGSTTTTPANTAARDCRSQCCPTSTDACSPFPCRARPAPDRLRPTLALWGAEVLGDQAHHDSHVLTPVREQRGRPLGAVRKEADKAHSSPRVAVERRIAHLKSWKILAASHRGRVGVPPAELVTALVNSPRGFRSGTGVAWSGGVVHRLDRLRGVDRVKPVEWAWGSPPVVRWGLVRWGLVRWGLVRWGLVRWGPRFVVG